MCSLRQGFCLLVCVLFRVLRIHDIVSFCNFPGFKFDVTLAPVVLLQLSKYTATYQP